MSKELAEKLGQMDMEGVDVTDANAVAQMMGYGTDTTAQGDTTTAAPTDTAATPAAAPVAPAAEPAPVESSAPPAAATESPGEIAGVLTKDGKHVIPHKVLQDTRTSLSLQRQRAEALEEANKALLQQVEDLKTGRTAVGTTGQYTPEQIAEIETDFPQLAPLLRTVEILQAKVASTASTPQAPQNPQDVADEEAEFAAALDLAIASRPLLSKYRDTGGVVWSRACEIDNALMGDSGFANASLAERFAEVERRLATELGIPVASTPNTSAAPAAPVPAAKAPAIAPTQPTQIMPTLTDLGGAGVSVGDPMSGMTAGQMVDKAMTMDMESLRRMAGLSY